MSTSSSEGKLFAYLCMGMIFGVITFIKGFRLRNKKKLIEDIPTSTVRGMAVGLVEVKGKAREFQQLLCSHFYDAKCVYYHYKVEELKSSGKHRQWVTIAEYASPELFYLEDETGKVLVSPSGAEFHLHADRNYNSQNRTEFFPKLQAIGIEPSGFLGFDRSLRCSEAYIAPGDELYVMGTAQPNEISHGSATGCENLLIAKNSDSFFFIAAESEKEILSDFGWKMYLSLYGGPALTVVCLFVLIGHYFKHFF